jgi:sugar transferase (PEP-CTERM/EpsH1 system associated)
MKILYVCHRIPYPPQKGDKIRSYHQVRYLSERHEVHLFCLADQQEDLAHADTLRKFCATVEVEYLNPRWAKLKSLAALLGGRPLTLDYFHSGALEDKVRAAARRIDFDAAVAYSSGMAPYVMHLGLPVALDFVDLDSQKWLQYAGTKPWPLSWLYHREGETLFDYECRAAARADASILVTEEEGRVLRDHGEPRNLKAVSLGVDLAFYDGAVGADAELASLNRPILIFVGRMDYWPNCEGVVRFARKILPRVTAEVPDVLFLVVGAAPTPEIRALHNGSSIRVTGRVPDTRPYLRAADLSVAPLSLARGIQTKVLEAMAARLPVVLFPGADVGIHAVSGRDYQVVATDEEMAMAVVRLLQDGESRKRMGQSARTFVEQHFQWADKLKAYERILLQISGQAPI